jgi:predicted Na+-dependent transporter
MMMSVLSVVIAPTAIGLVMNQFMPAVTEALKPITPLVGVVMTSCLCAAPIAGISEVCELLEI